MTKNHRLVRHWLPSILCAIMLFPLVGCSGSGTPPADTQGSDAPTANAPADTKGPDATGAEPPAEQGGDGTAHDPFGRYDQTLEFTCSRYVQTNSNLPEGDTYEDNAYTRYLLDRINAKLVTGFEAPGGEDYDRQVSLAITSGDIPDIMTVTSVSVFQELIANDLIADLTDAYADYASPGLKEKYDSYEGRALGKATVDGRLMGLTNAMGDGAPEIVWLREDWLKELGMDSLGGEDQVLKLSELEDTVRKFMAADPGKTGNPVGMSMEASKSASFNATNYGGAHNALAVNSVFKAYPKLWLRGADGKVTYGSIQPETKTALSKLSDWYKEGLLDPQIGTRTWDDIGALLINNNMGVAFGAWHIPDWLLTSVKEMNPTATFKAFVLVDDNGKANAFHTNAANTFVVVRKGFSNPELAVKIANVFYDELSGKITDEAILNYQSIGVDNSTKPLFIEVGSADNLVTEYEKIRSVVWDGADPSIIPSTGNQTIAQLCKDYEKDPAAADTTMWARYHSRMKGIEEVKRMYDKDYLSWVDPVFWGSTPMMEDRMSNLDTLENETFIKIITGEQPIDAFDAFVTTWKAEGGDAILGEIETAIAEE